jgi:hypothetical protein
MAVSRSGATPRRARPVAVAAAGLLSLALLGGCTGGGTPETARAPAPTATSAPPTTGPGTTLAPDPVPLTVWVTRVAGRLDKERRRSVERAVRRTLSRYLDTAFLGGGPGRGRPSQRYYARAFRAFTPGAARAARRDRALLTNAGLDRPVASVTERHSSARLAVLAPNHVPAGVTATIRVVYVANRDSARDTRVTMTGRLLLTRAGSRHWRIFGYDLARATRTVGGSAR